MRTGSGTARFTPARVVTSSGEIEDERLSRCANALEALVVALLLLLAYRTGIGLPPEDGGNTLARIAGLALAVLTGVYTVLIAPRMHGDGWHGLGLSVPLELRGEWTRRGAVFRTAAVMLAAAVPALLAWAGWDAMLVRLGIRSACPATYEQMTRLPWNVPGSVLAAVAIGTAFATFLIRWDNLAASARAVCAPFGMLIAGILIAGTVGAAVSGDWTRFSGFTWLSGNRPFLPRLAAYLPWAVLQQWFFLAYLNTRVRKVVPEGGWGGIPGRAISAALTGLAFGALHWPNGPLVVVTFAGGCASGWLFQLDRSRNLFVLGLAHAAAGALLATFTAFQMGVGARL